MKTKKLKIRKSKKDLEEEPRNRFLPTCNPQSSSELFMLVKALLPMSGVTSCCIIIHAGVTLSAIIAHSR